MELKQKATRQQWCDMDDGIESIKVSAPSVSLHAGTKHDESHRPGEVSDLETETTTTSRMSNSRPSHFRSIARKAKRREAHLARAVAKNLESGVIFTPTSAEDHRAEQKKHDLQDRHPGKFRRAD